MVDDWEAIAADVAIFLSGRGWEGRRPSNFKLRRMRLYNRIRLVLAGKAGLRYRYAIAFALFSSARPASQYGLRYCLSNSVRLVLLSLAEEKYGLCHCYTMAFALFFIGANTSFTSPRFATVYFRISGKSFFR